MPRTDNLTNVPLWASSGSALKNLNARPGEPALTPTDGYTLIYGQQDGSKATLEQFNQMFSWSTELINELNKHGIFEWHASVVYEHPALVFGSNAVLYRSVQNSTGQNPTTDSSNTYWQGVVPTDRLLPENNGPSGSYLSGNKQWGSLSTDAATALQGRLVPASPTQTPASQYLDGNHNWRLLYTELAGRLLPEAAGADGTVLLGDKTFGSPPGGYHREELAFGDIIVQDGWHNYPTTAADITARTMFATTDYNVNDWHQIEIYVASNANTTDRTTYSQIVTPGLIPAASHTDVDTWNMAMDRFDNGTRDFDDTWNRGVSFAQTGNRLVLMTVRIWEQGSRMGEHGNATEDGIHCGIYGIRY